jgi:hypothetical protein
MGTGGSKVQVEKTTTNSEMRRFNSALRSVLKVSKSELQKMLASDKASRADRPKPGPRRKASSSVPAADESD